MKPTEVLKKEHRVIEQVLNCLEKMADGCEQEHRLVKAHARGAVDFFRNFADRCHHGKEEALLFPMLEAKGFSSDCGPTAVMRSEHDMGRVYVRAMDEAIAGAAAGQPEALEAFINNARGYLQLLRQHIQKEDNCLFPMADQALGDPEQRDLMDQFEKVEREEMGEGTHERFHEIANELAKAYGLSAPEHGH
jgi:hemerythrin-like domain-containing protein